MDPRGEEAFEFHTCGGADLLDHGAPLPDHNGFLRLAFHEDGAVHRCNVPRNRLLKPIHHYGRRERQLIAREPQYLFAHDLADEEAIRLVGDEVWWVHRLSLRQVLEEQPLEHIDVRTVDG